MDPFKVMLFLALSGKSGPKRTCKRSVDSRRISKAYALLLEVPKLTKKKLERVRFFFLDHGIEVIQDHQINPSCNSNFEAIWAEVLLESDGQLVWNFSGHATALIDQLFEREYGFYKNDVTMCPKFFKKIHLDETIVKRIEPLLASNPNMLLWDTRSGIPGWTLFDFAINGGHDALFTTLLKCGADVTRSVPLFTAVQKGALGIAQTLLEKGANPNSVTNDVTPLHCAIRNFDNEIAVPMVKLLLDFGADVELTDDKGNPPLWYVRESVDIFRLLVEKGASINFQTTDDKTVLQHSMAHGWTELVNCILQFQPDPTVKGNRMALYTALSRFEEENVEVINRMIQQGFSVREEDLKDDSLAGIVFFGSIYKGLLGLLQNVLDHRSDKINDSAWVPSPIYGRVTPLDFALKFDKKESIQLLLDRGATVSLASIAYMSLDWLKHFLTINTFKKTDPYFLLFAIKGASCEILEFLFEEGIDPNMQLPVPRFFQDDDSNSNKIRLCMKAVFSSRNSDVIDVLTKYGARFTYEDLLDCTTSQNTTWVCSFLWAKALAHCPTIISDTDLQALKDFPKMFEVLLHSVKLDLLNPGKNIINKILEAAPEKYKSDEMKKLKVDCEAEMKKLTSKIARTNFIYRDILVSNVDRISRFANNKAVVAALEPKKIKERFPLYGSILNCRFRKGVQRGSLKEKAVPVLRFLFRKLPRLPDDIMETLINFLGNRDLVVLPKCLPTKEKKSHSN